jgi:hypothetical protein
MLFHTCILFHVIIIYVESSSAFNFLVVDVDSCVGQRYANGLGWRIFDSLNSSYNSNPLFSITDTGI